MKHWRPKEGEKYWFILIAPSGIWINSVGYYDWYRPMWYNCFPTRKLAQAKLKQIRALLKK